MDSFCVVLNCPNKDYSIIKLHNFPKDPGLLRDWCSNLKKTPSELNSKKNSKVCALHFESSMVGLKRLKRSAIPTLFLGHNDNIIRPKIGRKLARSECSVPKCSSISPPCILFEFPEKPLQRMEWMKVCGLAHISWREHFVICNKHFLNEPEVLNESLFPQLLLPSSRSYDNGQKNLLLPETSSYEFIQNDEIRSNIPSINGGSPTPQAETIDSTIRSNLPTSVAMVEIQNEHSSPTLPFNQHTSPTIDGHIETTLPECFLSPSVLQSEIIIMNQRRMEDNLLRTMRSNPPPPPRTPSTLHIIKDESSTEFMDIDKEIETPQRGGSPESPTPFNYLGSSSTIDLSEIKQESSLYGDAPMTVIHSEPPIDRIEIKQESWLHRGSTPLIYFESSSLNGSAPMTVIHSEPPIDQIGIKQKSSSLHEGTPISLIQSEQSFLNGSAPMTVIHSEPPIDQIGIKQKSSSLHEGTPISFIQSEQSFLNESAPMTVIHSEPPIDQIGIKQKSSSLHEGTPISLIQSEQSFLNGSAPMAVIDSEPPIDQIGIKQKSSSLHEGTLTSLIQSEQSSLNGSAPMAVIDSEPPIDQIGIKQKSSSLHEGTLTSLIQSEQSSLNGSAPTNIIHSEPPIDLMDHDHEPSTDGEFSTPFVRYESSIDQIEIKHEPSLHGGSPAPSLHSDSSSSIDQTEIIEESSTSNSRANSCTTAPSCRKCAKSLKIIKMYKSNLIKNRKGRLPKIKQQCNEIVKLKHQISVLNNVLLLKRLGTNIKLKITCGRKREILSF